MENVEEEEEFNEEVEFTRFDTRDNEKDSANCEIS